LWQRNAGAHGFDLARPGHEEGYTFKHLELRGTAGAMWGFYLYDDIDHVVIEDVIVDGFDIGLHVHRPHSCTTGMAGCSLAMSDDIRLERVSITNSANIGFLGTANRLVIANSKFDRNGGGPKGGTAYNHNIYLGSSAGDGIRVLGNELHGAARDAAGVCRGTSLVVHGSKSNVIIADNYIHEDIGTTQNGCWGIGVVAGYAGEAENMRDVTIRGNRVINMGNVAIGVSSCIDCMVENNVVVQEQPVGGNAIQGPAMMRGSEDPALQRLIVRNNSIYVGANAKKFLGVEIGTEGTNHVIVSNAIHYAGKESGACFSSPLPASSYTAIDYNLCHAPNAASGQWAKGTASLSDWTSKTAFDAHSSTRDPGFLAPSGPSHDLSAASRIAGMVDAGHPSASSPIDIQGGPRALSPDVGAYEHGNNLDSPAPGTDSGSASPSAACAYGPTGPRGLGCALFAFITLSLSARAARLARSRSAAAARRALAPRAPRRRG
jgi:hypothetical protein